MLRPQARPWAVPATSLAQGVAGMRAGREVAALRGAQVQRHPGLDWVRPLHGSAASVETEVSPGNRGLCRGAAGNPRFPRLLPGTLGNFPGCL